MLYNSGRVPSANVMQQVSPYDVDDEIKIQILGMRYAYFCIKYTVLGGSRIFIRKLQWMFLEFIEFTR